MSTSAEAVAWAWRQSPGTCGAKFLLVALAGEAARVKDGPYVAEPGLARLVQLTGMNESTVVRNLKMIVDSGCAVRERGIPDASGRRVRDRFVIPVAVVTSTAQPANRLHAERKLARDLHEGPTCKTPSPKPDIPESPSCNLHEQVLKDLKTKPKSSSAPPPPTPSPDVIRLCDQLARHVERTIGKKPVVSHRWHEACRLLIERDGRTPESVAKAIEWSQADDFWRTVVLSMANLRSKYDTMLAQASRPKAPPTRDFTAEREQQIKDRIERRRADPYGGAFG